MHIRKSKRDHEFFRKITYRETAFVHPGGVHAVRRHSDRNAGRRQWGREGGESKPGAARRAAARDPQPRRAIDGVLANCEGGRAIGSEYFHKVPAEGSRAHRSEEHTSEL